MEGGYMEGIFRKRVLEYLKLDEDYYIVFTANALSAFRLLAHSYPFHDSQNFLHAYDHICENVEAVAECANAKGARIRSVNLSVPDLRVDEKDLHRKLQCRRSSSSDKLSKKGLYAYPYSSRVTGRKISPQWILEAQRNGWHVLLDATCAEAKFSESMRLSFFSPDFIICSFYHVFGEDPAGFGCLLIKRPVLQSLGASSRARFMGMVKIVPATVPSSKPNDISELYSYQSSPREKFVKQMHDIASNAGFSDCSRNGTTSIMVSSNAISSHNEAKFGTAALDDPCSFQDVSVSMELSTMQASRIFSSYDAYDEKYNGWASFSSSEDTTTQVDSSSRGTIYSRPFNYVTSMDVDFAFRGLDYADILGYNGVAIRLRALSDWLVSSLLKLRHPLGDRIALVKLYSPLSSAERGSSIAFTLSDYTGNVMDPKRVQMLADRNGISLGTATIAGRVSSMAVQKIGKNALNAGCLQTLNHKWWMKGEAMYNVNVPVIYASLGFLNNFGDVYMLFLFLLRFLDPDFVRQEVWHYQALNQKTIEI
ncbi:hypothetical protein KP509_03G074300 [Ceratopteris richardii]|nr:hypothetical protein KP509_03G074300 [Ceratopteris richardii]